MNAPGHITGRIHEELLRRALLPVGDLVFGQRMMSRLRFLEAAQWWDRAAIIAARDQLLRELVQVAYDEVPFYRDLFDANSLKPGDIRCAEDLPKLPVVTKDMLRRSHPASTTRPTGQKTYESFTSGSTGANFSVTEDRATAGWYRASFLLSLEWAGWRLGQRHLQTGMNTSRSADRWLKDRMMRCHYVSSIDLSDAALDAHLDWLERTGTRHLWGYPAMLYHLALRALSAGREIRLSSVVTWGDTVYQHYRDAIESAFSTRVFDTYGASEGMHIAAQCGQGNHYHVHSFDVVVEYLDEDMAPVKPGEVGNIIVTRLHPGPMPLIRYRIGDVGVSGGDRKCACGRGFEIMECIHGRESDVVLTPSGNRLITHVFTGTMRHHQEVDNFQIFQESLDTLTVRVVAGKGYSDSVGDEVVRHLRQVTGGELSIRIETVDQIPLPPTGKRRFIITQVGEHPSVPATSPSVPQV